jgi:hypothetical protein
MRRAPAADAHAVSWQGRPAPVLPSRSWSQAPLMLGPGSVIFLPICTAWGLEKIECMAAATQISARF